MRRQARRLSATSLCLGTARPDITERADILVFDKPSAFSEGDPPYGSIVIIDLKHPERKNFPTREKIRLPSIWLRKGLKRRKGFPQGWVDSPAARRHSFLLLHPCRLDRKHDGICDSRRIAADARWRCILRRHPDFELRHGSYRIQKSFRRFEEAKSCAVQTAGIANDVEPSKGGVSSHASWLQLLYINSVQRGVSRLGRILRSWGPGVAPRSRYGTTLSLHTGRSPGPHRVELGSSAAQLRMGGNAGRTVITNGYLTYLFAVNCFP
jgi:hypothetical protein